MKTLLIVSALLLSVASAQAQVVTVNINKATMEFTWTQGSGDPADGFRWKCGNATLNYTVITDVPDPSHRSIAVNKAIKGTGTWFCVVAAYNKVGEAGPSNEVNFFAGATPSGSIVLTPPK